MYVATWWFVVLLVVLVLLVALALVVRDGDPAADAARVAGYSPVLPAEAEICHLYLARHRRHRRVGGIVGGLLAVAVSLRWYGTLSLGIVETPLADPLSCTLAGIVVGALSAETYRIGRHRRDGDTRTASLSPRPELPGRRRVAVARALLAVALLLAGLRAITGDLGPLLLAVTAAGLLVVADLTRSAVRHRPRPVLSGPARQIDAGMRRFAADTVAWLETAVAVLALTWVVAAWPATLTDGAVGGGPVVLLGYLTCAVLLVKAAPRASRAMRARTAGPAEVVGAP